MFAATFLLSAQMCTPGSKFPCCQKPKALKVYVGVHGGNNISLTPYGNARRSTFLSGVQQSVARGNFLGFNPHLGVQAGIRHYCGEWFVGMEGSSSFLFKDKPQESMTPLEKQQLRVHKDWSHECSLHLGKDIDNFTIYAKGGVNYARISYLYSGDANWDGVDPSPFEDNKGTERFGAIFGAGLEYKLTPGITIGAEAAYSQLRKFERKYNHEAEDGRVNGFVFSPRDLSAKVRLAFIF